jgi:hypothetical protein
MTHHVKHPSERRGETSSSGAIALQQMKRHALRRFRPDARQAAQRCHQFI